MIDTFGSMIHPNDMQYDQLIASNIGIAGHFLAFFLPLQETVKGAPEL